MAVVNDKQFYVLLGIGAVALVVGGFISYKAVKAVSGAVGGAVDYVKNDAASDALDVAGDAATFVVGEPTANAIKETGGYLSQLWDWIGVSDVQDKFDLNYRDQQPNMTDEEYQRWKTAVQAGEIENKFKAKI